LFLFLNDGSERTNAIRQGFDERLSGLGAVSISLPLAVIARPEYEATLAEVQGMWDPSFDFVENRHLGLARDVPTVSLRGRVDPTRDDAVSFDDFQGGRTATEHLLAFGTRSAVFLGVHSPGVPSGQLDWSASRAEGFMAAMASVGRESSATVLVPPSVVPRDTPNDPFDYFGMGALLARQVELTDTNTGIVAANDRVAYGFIAERLRLGDPPELVPPVIGFDNSETNAGTHLSSMALPWSELGRVAADVLFRRATGTLTGSPVAEVVAMVPITRPSSGRGWLARTPFLLEALRQPNPEASLFD